MNDHDFDVSIHQSIHETYQFRSELTLYYVLDGTLQVSTNGTEYQLKKEDLLLLDTGERDCRIDADEAMIFRVVFDTQFVGRVLGSRKGSFHCNSAADRSGSYTEVRNVVKKLIYQQAIRTHKTESYEIGLCYQLFDLLVENYMVDSDVAEINEKTTAFRMNEILRYVHQNYQYHMNLSELAEQMYVSTSTLSRLFKKETGIYFADYVNQVRLKYVVMELKNTEDTVTRIAMNCGFSNAAAMNRVFRDKYQISPTEYRNEWKKKEEQREQENYMLRDQLVKEVEKSGLNEQLDMEKPKVEAAVDLSQTREYHNNWNRAINIGSLTKLGEVNIQFQTLNVVKELGFTHVRIWNIFSKHLMITDGKTIGNYNYDKLDMIFDFLVNNQIAPFLDFGRRPDTALKKEGMTLFFEEEYIEFESREHWEHIIKDIVHHFILRYGKDVVEEWIFELTFTLAGKNKFYREEDFEYTDAFEFFFKTVKKELPNAEVGGYSASMNESREGIEHFLFACKQKGIAPDFLSMIMFPYDQIQKEDNILYCKRSTEQELDIRCVRRFRKCLDQMGLPGCKLYITEWNNSLSNRNFLNDSCFRSAYVVKKISELWSITDMMCLWFASDWISTYYDTRSIVNGAGGILTKDNIKKPAWFALAFLNALGKELVEIGENYIVTRKSDSSFVILCFNFKWFGGNYFFMNEDEVTPEDLQNLFEDEEPMELNLRLTGLTDNGEYIVKKSQVSSEHGCVLSEWLQMGKDENLDREDIKYIQQMTVPYMSREKIQSKEGTLDIHVELKVQEIALLRVYQ